MRTLKNIIKFLVIVAFWPFKLLIKALIEVQGLPQIRQVLGELFVVMRLSAHLNYTEKVKAQYNIHPTVYWGEDTLIYGNGNISVGENTYFGRNSYILSHPAGVNLKIGKHCSISHSVHIRTEQNKKKIHYQDDISSPPSGADIVIGDYVWIGAHVFIRGGVSIGDNSIIGANSVVTHDVPANSVYGGVPARFIRHKDDYRSV